MRRLRVAARLFRILLVIVLGLGMACFFSLAERLGSGATDERRQRWSRMFMRRLSAALPFRVTVIGQVPRQPMLWVSNHVSWTDIPLLGMLAPLSFLSKAEVRHWPVAGWLALKAGTLFIRRGGNDGQRLREQIGGQLREARPLVIFPEGTTTDGHSVRTFHGRLLAGAIDAGTPLQPVAIRYHRAGETDTVAPFVGDDDLVSHLMRLLREDLAEVRIRLLVPIATCGRERAALAFEARQAIQAALFGVVQEEITPCRQTRAA